MTNLTYSTDYRSFTIHHSQFTIHNSPFTIHHSQFTIHHSSPITHHPSPITHHSSNLHFRNITFYNQISFSGFFDFFHRNSGGTFEQFEAFIGNFEDSHIGYNGFYTLNSG